MSDVSGIPNMGFGGGGYFGGSAALGLPAMSAGQINSSMGWNPMASYNPWANTPGGFGGQTDYYSNLGAAFGRNTGGFNASTFGGGGGDNTLDNGGGTWTDPFTQGAAPQAAPGAGSSSSYNPFAQYNSGGWNPYAAQTFAPAAQPNAGGSYGAGMFSGGGGRDYLAELMRQNASPPQQNLTPQYQWGQNFWNASPPANTVGNSSGMAPGYGGFNNSAGGPSQDNFFGGNYGNPFGSNSMAGG